MNPFRRISRRRFLQLAGAVTLGGAATGASTWLVEPHWIEVVRRDLPLAHLPNGLVGKTLVQLSDLHIGRAVSDDFLLRAFEITASLRPDILAITGDFMTCHAGEELDHTMRVLE